MGNSRVMRFLTVHRKKIAVHGLVLVGYVLYAVFLAGPVFDRFEAIQEEAQLSSISLPSQSTNDIVHFLRPVQSDGLILEVVGFAFIEGQGAEGAETCVVLRSGRETYVFDTVARQVSPAAVEAHGERILMSGFRALIPARKVPAGEYAMGIYIRKGELEALRYLDEAVVKSGGSIAPAFRTSHPYDLALPSESQGIVYGLEGLRQAELDEREMLLVYGWAFAEGHSAENSDTYLVLESDSRAYVFDTIMLRRPDITVRFGEPAVIPLANPSFESGDPPDFWTSMHGDFTRSTARVRQGSHSGRLVQDSAEQWAIAYRTSTDPDRVEWFKGRTVTVGAWVWASEPERVRVGLGDRVDGDYDWSGSSYHPGDGNWHLLAVTRTFREDMERFSFRPLWITGGDTVVEAYVDDVTMTEAVSGLDLDNSGFLARIPLESVEQGIYRLGIYIEKEGVKALEYTNTALVKSDVGFERAIRASVLESITLPAESRDITLSIDKREETKIGEKGLLEVEGWAFIDGQSAEDSWIYLVLESDAGTYVFDTISQRRPDVTDRFGPPGVNLDDSGFLARILADGVGDGIYKLGIYVRKGDVEALQFTKQGVTITEGSVRPTIRMSNLHDEGSTTRVRRCLIIPLIRRQICLPLPVSYIKHPAESDDIVYRMDRLETVVREGQELVEMEGWAFLEGRSAEDNWIYVVLKSESWTYVFDTILQERKDVTAYFGDLGLDLDESGFVARIPAEMIRSGTYELGILIRKGDLETLTYTGRILEF